jgi:acyl-CoA-dependent ceramide synthase
MPLLLKAYYLLQASYWLQQTICELLGQAPLTKLTAVLAGKIEKPRKDFKELVAHVS